MKSESLKISKGSVDMSEGRRSVLRLLGGGGALLLASGCAVDATDADAENVGSVEQAYTTPQGVHLVYMAAFGRAATDAEVSYWVTAPGNMRDMYRYLRSYMRTKDGQRDRLNVITYAYQTVYGRLYNNNEVVYWMNYLGSNDAAFCDVCKWLEFYGRDNGYPFTGSWYTIKHVVDSHFQADISVENYSGKKYRV